jgi:hypothetical protein
VTLLVPCMQVTLLEQESAALKDEDRQLSRLLADMAAQRDRCVCAALSHHTCVYTYIRALTSHRAPGPVFLNIE